MSPYPCILFCTFLLAMAISSNASAQTIDGAAYFSPITDNVQPLIHGNLFSKTYLSKRSDPRSRSGKPSLESRKRTAGGGRSAAGRSDDASLVLRFDPIISNRVRDDYIQAIARGSNAAAAELLRRYYTSNDARQLLDKALQPYGLRSNDLADITTAHLVVLWMTAHQIAPPPAAQVRGLRSQVRAMLLEDGPLPSSSVERQRIGEALIYQAVTLIRAREVAQQQNNQRYLKQLASSARSTLESQGFHLQRLVLTDEGLQSRDG